MSPSGSDTPAIAICRTASRHAGASFRVYPGRPNCEWLDQFIKRGGIALPCNLALNDVIEIIKKKDNVSPEEARKQAIAALVPGRDPATIRRSRRCTPRTSAASICGRARSRMNDDVIPRAA
jgi:hypothetical protein